MTVSKWRAFVDSLDTDGGQTIVLLVLILIGGVLSYLGTMHGDYIVVGAFGALTTRLKNAGSNTSRAARYVGLSEDPAPTPPAAPAGD